MHQNHTFYDNKALLKLSMFARSERPNFWHALFFWRYFKHIKVSEVAQKISLGKYGEIQTTSVNAYSVENRSQKIDYCIGCNKKNQEFNISIVSKMLTIFL